jgi:hypothetical protein
MPLSGIFFPSTPLSTTDEVDSRFVRGSLGEDVCRS